MASLLLLFFCIEFSPVTPVFQEGLCQILLLVLAPHRHRLLRPHRNVPLAPPHRISRLAPLPARLVAPMVAAVCVPARHDPAAALRARLADPAALVPVALAALVVVPAVRVPAGLVVVLVVVALVAMAREVAAEAARMVAAMVTGQRQPRHAQRPSPSSRAARWRFPRRLSSRIWRKCSMSRSMRSFAT